MKFSEVSSKCYFEFFIDNRIQIDHTIHVEKVCLGCQLKKTLDEFNFKNREKNTRQSQCKACTRSQIQKHYYKKRTYYLKKAKERNRKLRQEIQSYVWKYLQENPCVDCGEKDIVVLTFDHKGDKRMNISEMTKWRFGIQAIKQEIAKCDVRCANCHLRKTAKDFGWKKNLVP